MRPAIVLGGGFGLPKAIALSVVAHALLLWLPGPWRLTGGGQASDLRQRPPRYDVSWNPHGDGSPGSGAGESSSLPLVGRPAQSPEPVPPVAPPPTEAIRPTEPASLPVGEASTGSETPLGGSTAGPGFGPGGTGSAGGLGTAGPGTEAGVPVYQPPRLLAGALPIDPREVDALDVPPEIPVRIRVGADGSVLEVIAETQSLSPPVLEAVRRSAQAMRFDPARRNGEPVEAWFSMTFVHRR